MSAFTPGPWVAVHYTEVSRIYTPGNHGHKIADVHSYSVDASELRPNRDARNANADLMAAAPIMLAALQTVMPTGIDTTNRNVSDDQVIPVDVTMRELRLMRAAISLARGQSSSVEGGGQ